MPNETYMGLHKSFLQESVSDPWRFYGAIIVAALAVRFLNLASIDDLNVYAQIEDSPIYWNGAQAWIESGYFSRKSIDGFVPETERMPLYHLFLVPFRWLSPDELWPVIVAQSLIDSITCAFIAAIGMILSHRVGAISGLLAAIWPNMIIFSNLVLGDSLCLFFATVGLFASLRCLREPRYPYVLIAGVFFGLMILVRPIGLFVPLFAAAFIAGRIIWQEGSVRRAITFAMLMVALVTMLLSPILWRNVTQFGTWQLTSQSGVHFLMWVVSYTKSIESGIPFSEGTAQINAKLEKRIMEARSAKPVVKDSEYSGVEFYYSDHAMALAKEELKDVSLITLVRVWGTGMIINLGSPAIMSDLRIRSLNTASFMNSVGSGIIQRLRNFLLHNSPVYVFWIFTGLTMSCVVSMLQFIGVILLCRRNLFLGAVGIGWVLYFLFIPGPVASPKYRLPIEPFLIIVQAMALSMFFSKVDLVGWVRKLKSSEIK